MGAEGGTVSGGKGIEGGAGHGAVGSAFPGPGCEWSCEKHEQWGGPHDSFHCISGAAR